MSTSEGVVDLDPKKPFLHSVWNIRAELKPFPIPVITIIGLAALTQDKFCQHTGITGNNIHAISKKYDSANAVCSKCRFGNACQEYMAYKH